MTNVSPRIAIVMYHYVRPIQGSRFPRIKGLELTDFLKQLDFLEATTRIISPEDFNCIEESSVKPGQLLSLLTFDDGLADHYEYVFPELQKRGIKAMFFPSSLPFEEGKIANVHQIQFILEAFQDARQLRQKIEELLVSMEFNLDSIESRVPESVGHYDLPVEKTIKFLLQRALPTEIRDEVADILFERYVSCDTKDFLNSLYMSKNQLIEMKEFGMTIGSHGRSHNWLEDMTLHEQQRDIVAGLNFLETIQRNTDNDMKSFTYPFGSYNEDTLKILEDQGIEFAFTVKKEFYETGKYSSFEIPRFDTNDIYEALES